MLRQRAKGKESDRYIYARSAEREKKIERYTVQIDHGKFEYNL